MISNSPLVSKSSMLKKDSKMSQAVARHAVQPVNNAAISVAVATRVASARCIRQFAPSVESKPKFLLPRVATVRFIAGTASRRPAVSAVKS